MGDFLEGIFGIACFIVAYILTIFFLTNLWVATGKLWEFLRIL